MSLPQEALRIIKQINYGSGEASVGRIRLLFRHIINMRGTKDYKEINHGQVNFLLMPSAHFNVIRDQLKRVSEELSYSLHFCS